MTQATRVTVLTKREILNLIPIVQYPFSNDRGTAFKTNDPNKKLLAGMKRHKKYFESCGNEKGTKRKHRCISKGATKMRSTNHRSNPEDLCGSITVSTCVYHDKAGTKHQHAMFSEAPTGARKHCNMHHTCTCAPSSLLVSVVTAWRKNRVTVDAPSSNFQPTSSVKSLTSFSVAYATNTHVGGHIFRGSVAEKYV